MVKTMKTLLVCFAVVLTLLAVTADNLMAGAVAHSRGCGTAGEWCYVGAYGICYNSNTGVSQTVVNTASGNAPKNANALCFVIDNAHANAQAWAWCDGNQEKVRTRVTVWTAKGGYAWGGKDKPSGVVDMADSTVAIDSVEVGLTANAGLATINVTGKMRAREDMSGARLNVKFYQNADSTDVVYEGEAFLDKNGNVEVSGDFVTGDFVANLVGSEYVIDLGFSGNAGYVGPDSLVGVIMEGDGVRTEIPTLTGWGLLALIVLLLTAGFLVIRKRRHVAA
jgi:hypothetical protein